MNRRRSQRGVSLIEATISLAVFALGLVGICEMQLVASREAVMARRLAQASALCHDLVDQVALWSYDDPRLTSHDDITSTTDAVVEERGADTRDADITASSDKPHYAEQATTNALNPSALYNATLGYDGLESPSGFERYWNVFSLDQNGDGVSDGKLVVVVVRWYEAGLGYRRISASTFRANPGGFSL